MTIKMCLHIHVPKKCQLRMLPDRILEVALRWMPAGRQKRGSPKTTWRTVEVELNEMDLIRRESRAIAEGKTQWRRDIVVDLCPTGGHKE